jgi:adenylate kinase
MRVLMIAPPGAGKGTQGALIATHFDIPHIATGELLRDHVARRTALGLAVQEYLDRGELVPDQVVLDMLREELIAAKAAGGAFVLDGIPRNMHQARAVYLIGRELGMTADVALHLQADDEELMRRLLARAALEHRSDDTTDIIAQRLALYHAVTSPIVSWYRDRGILVSVDAMRSAQQVGREILTALEAMRPFLDHVPGQARLSVDLTGLGDAFGAADSTAGTPDLADGLHRRSLRLIGAGWLDPGERRRAGCRVPDGLPRAVRGVVTGVAGGCGGWPAHAGLLCRGVRRRRLRLAVGVGGERGEGVGDALGHGRVVQPEDGYEACDLATVRFRKGAPRSEAGSGHGTGLLDLGAAAKCSSQVRAATARCGQFGH